MSVLYLITSSEPLIEGTDATFQEVAALSAAFNGATVSLSPRRVPGRPFPPQLLGLHRLAAIRRLERKCAITHVYHSVPYRLPVLRLLRNPIVYTVVASMHGLRKPPKLQWLTSLHCIAVSNPRDAAILQAWGLSNYAVVPPAINIDRITQSILPMRGEITVLMASAPWVEEQFDLKGIDALLDAIVALPNLRAILLWRGLLLNELNERVERRGIRYRVEIVTERVDIDNYLKRAHATVLLAKRSDIVKAYPHSLLESLVAGKPVILSVALPMADYVQQQGCGIVLKVVNAQALISAVEALRSRYDVLAQRARAIDATLFSQQGMIATYREIYRRGASADF